jgi:hypothetical protein
VRDSSVSWKASLFVALILASAVGCATAYRGAVVVDPGEVPRGRLVKTFARTACTRVDAPGPGAFVDYVQGMDGVPFLVERARTGTWLLVTNSWLDGSTIVFQAVRRDPSGLVEYRFPERGSKQGQYSWSRYFEEPKGATHRFETRSTGGTAATCTLTVVDPLTGAPVGTYGGEGSTQGWGFDGESFRVGDRILVEVGGRSVPAVVLQASGNGYFVRLEGEDENAGRWIEPSTITGRLE